MQKPNFSVNGLSVCEKIAGILQNVFINMITDFNLAGQMASYEAN